MTLVEMNKYTLDLEITENALSQEENKMVLTHELFSVVKDLPIFHDWLSTMNLKIGAEK